MRLDTIVLVAMYLGAIVLANVTFGIWEMASEPWNSMLLIGLDLTTRDRLHEAWGRRGLVWKMGLLILTGSALSALLGAIFARRRDPIAIASALAFGSTALVDALIFGLLRRRWARINGSNAIAALVDGVVFPTVAFGELDAGLVAYFAAVKFIGGALWWLALGGWRDLTALAPQHARRDRTGHGWRDHCASTLALVKNRSGTTHDRRGSSRPTGTFRSSSAP